MMAQSGQDKKKIVTPKITKKPVVQAGSSRKSSKPFSSAIEVKEKAPPAYDPFKDAIKYKSVDDDVVDKMLEDFIQKNSVKVPINRIDPSKYLFGTKVISAQIINGVLMVRVGGGFMNIEEFVEKHSTKEILSLKLKMNKERKKLPKVT